MLDRTALPPAPRAERRPTTSTRHGVTLTDDYAWLRADNWREVMRDPSVLDPAIRAYLEAENAYAEGRARAHRAAAGDAVRRDEGPHQGGRLLGAEPGRRARLLLPLSRRRPASDRLPPAARRRRGGGAARRRRARGRQGLLPARRRRVIRRTIGCSPGRPTTRDRNTTRCASASSATGSDLADVDPGRRRRAGLDRGFIGLLLRAARRQSSSVAGLSPSARHAGGGRRARLRGEGRALSSSRSGSCSPAASRKFRSTITRPRNAGCSTSTDPDATPSLVAARETSVQYDVEHHPDWNGEETLVIRTNADGAEDFKIALAPLARPGRENWRDLVPHRRGTYILSASSCWRTG